MTNKIDKKDVIKVGVVGYSSGKFDETTAKALLGIAFEIVESEHPAKSYELVSGLTDSGIPGIAYRLADKMGWRTIGFSAEEALKYDRYDVSEEIIIGKKFGDESEQFIDYIDCLIRIGGGPQSLDEVVMADDKNKSVYEFDLPREKEDQ